MTWLAFIAGTGAGGLAFGILAYYFGHLWGVSDGKQAEKTNRAEQDLRLTEARRDREEAHRSPWVTTPEKQLAPPRTPLIAEFNAKLAAAVNEDHRRDGLADQVEQWAASTGRLEDFTPGDDTRHDIPAQRLSGPQPVFIPAPVMDGAA
jgi:hypothetical protein